jgi:hypothetical protein
MVVILLPKRRPHSYDRSLPRRVAHEVHATDRRKPTGFENRGARADVLGELRYARLLAPLQCHDEHRPIRRDASRSRARKHFRCTLAPPTRVHVGDNNVENILTCNQRCNGGLWT